MGVTPTIYFLRAGEGPVKIGYTSRRGEYRLREAQTYQDRDLILLVETMGTKKDEDALHRMFRTSHIRGEWFHYTDDLSDLVMYLIEGGSLQSYLAR